jgi:copper oxidase (laccase) domain-containing protein
MKLAVGIHDGRIITMKQVHGDQIVAVEDTNIKSGEVDGMWTEKRNAFLGVSRGLRADSFRRSEIKL